MNECLNIFLWKSPQIFERMNIYVNNYLNNRIFATHCTTATSSLLPGPPPSSPPNCPPTPPPVTATPSTHRPMAMSTTATSSSSSLVKWPSHRPSGPMCPNGTRWGSRITLWAGECVWLPGLSMVPWTPSTLPMETTPPCSALAQLAPTVLQVTHHPI